MTTKIDKMLSVIINNKTDTRKTSIKEYIISETENVRNGGDKITYDLMGGDEMLSRLLLDGYTVKKINDELGINISFLMRKIKGLNLNGAIGASLMLEVVNSYKLFSDELKSPRSLVDDNSDYFNEKAMEAKAIEMGMKLCNDLNPIKAVPAEATVETTVPTIELGVITKDASIELTEYPNGFGDIDDNTIDKTSTPDSTTVTFEIATQD